MAVGFEIRQQANFLERLGRHGMRLVDQHDDAAAFAMRLDQVFLQAAQNLRQAGGFRDGQAQFVGNRVENIFARERGIGEVDQGDVGRQVFHQHPAKHGLAATDFTADFDDAFIVGDGVDQCIERRATIGAVEEKVGMRGNAKGWFAQAEVFEIHDEVPVG